MKPFLFGDLLKAIRKERGWTQAQACENVCDRRTYIRWETNVAEPSIYYLYRLSAHFNYDFQTYYRILLCDVTYQAQKYKSMADQAIEKRDWDALIQLVEKIENHEEFQLTPNKQAVHYYKAVYFFNKGDSKKSKQHILTGLKLEDETIDLENPLGKIHSNAGICLLNCYATVCLAEKNVELAKKIFDHALNSLVCKIMPQISHYQSTDFELKTSQAISYNLAICYWKENDYEKSLSYSQKGIQFALNYNCMSYFSFLTSIQFQNLYKLERYEEAKHYSTLCLNLFWLQGYTDFYKECLDIIKNDCPKLLSMSDEFINQSVDTEHQTHTNEFSKGN